MDLNYLVNPNNLLKRDTITKHKRSNRKNRRKKQKQYKTHLPYRYDNIFTPAYGKSKLGLVTPSREQLINNDS